MSFNMRIGYLIFLLCIIGIVPVCSKAQVVVPGFTVPDTICVNTPLKIINTSSGASTYFWNFCVADVNTLPTAINLGNPGGYLSQPVFVDLVEDNGSYYGFVVNHVPGGITRLDFGTSLLNTPNPVFLGNISGALNTNYGSEGIQIVKANGKWYGIVVGGNPMSGPGASPKLVTIYFGANINNPAPTAVNWGNLGNMLESIDLHVFQENGIWYGFTVNAANNTITRFNFTNSFDNMPTAVNLGNIGGLNYPTGVYALNDNGIWRVFVTNQGTSVSPSITRLDFGNSLLSTPTGVNLGNPGNLSPSPRDITILKLCGQSVGFVVNASNNIVRLNFNSPTSTPTATSLGNLGNLNLSHSLSKLFRAGNDIYSLITNVSNNTITRLKFTGCSNSNITSSNLQNPPSVTYNAPGVYNINLTVDDGMPTQTTLCKQVVVLSPPVHSPTQNFLICNGTNLKIGSSIRPATYSWSTGAVADSIVVNTPGIYWVESARYGCTVRDSFVVAYSSNAPNDCDSIKITGLNKVCSRIDTVTYAIYKSSTCTQQYVFQADSTFATIVGQTSTSIKLIFKQNGTTSLKVMYSNNCKSVTDSMAVAIRFSPTAVNLGPNITTCRDTALTLHVGNGFNTYLWQNGSTDSILFVNNPGSYSIIAQNDCNVQYKDTLNVIRQLPAAFSVLPLTATACKGDSLQFKASGGTSYSWLPADNFNHPNAASPKAYVDVSRNFILSISDSLCKRDTTINIPVTVMPEAQISIVKSNDITCSVDSTTLTGIGGVTYTWFPNSYITNNSPGKIIVKPPQAVTYYVEGKNASGCSGKDSVKINFIKEGDQKMFIPNAFTPDGNGSNDIFRPILIGSALRYSFAVYNRWGQMIFKTENPRAGWNGTYQGIIQPQGVYVYYVNAEGSCNNLFVRKGTFVLIR